MNKKLFLFIVIIIFLIVSFLLINNNQIEIVSYDSNNSNNEKEMLAIILETDVNTGEYEQSTSSRWPSSSDYIYNENLSYCENGSTLIWNEETWSINLSTGIADKCYLYFDVYNPPTLVEYIINSVYVEDGVNGLYYHDGQGDLQVWPRKIKSLHSGHSYREQPKFLL